MSNEIFISHKSSDKGLADEFKKCLIYAGIPNDSIFIAEELHPGEEWQPAILDALESSQVFYLLYTDPGYDWDWCLFEAGYWSGIRQGTGKPGALICINAGVGRPSPLNHWQDIHEGEDFAIHVMDLFTRTPPLDFLAGKAYNGSVSSDIEQFWKTRISPQRKGDTPIAILDNRCTLSITVKNEQMERIKSGRDIPGEVEIEMNIGALGLFPYAREAKNWDGFVDGLDEAQKPWSACFGTLLRMLNGKNRESPFLPLVRAGQADPNGVLPIYHPFVSTRLEYEDGRLTFQIEFVRRSDAIPVIDDTDRLYQYLILARNFRSNVLQRYQKDFKKGVQFDKKVSGLLDEIELVRLDILSRGLNPQEDFPNLMTPDICQELFRIMEEWNESERLLRRMYDNSNFDHSEVSEIMERLLHKNLVFSLVICGALQGRLCFK